MKRWRVGDVQRLGADGVAGEAWGVTLYDETGRPCVVRSMPPPCSSAHSRSALKASCRSARTCAQRSGIIAVLAQNEEFGERGGPPGS